MKYLYLYIDLLSFAGPFLLSFDKKVAFWKSWKRLFPAILIMSAVFIPWDIWKTKAGVWGFNPDYLSGIYLFGLPLEEYLFFLVVPYACVFIYACLNAYIRKDVLYSFHRPLLFFMAMVWLVAGIMSFPRMYPFVTFLLSALFSFFLLYKRPIWLSRFLLAYFVSLIPFLVVNGILTGSWIAEPIVWYNSDHIFNVRMGTIPIEDTVYNFLMLSLTVFFFEMFRIEKQDFSSSNK